MGEATLGKDSYSQCLILPATLVIADDSNLEESAFVDFIHSSLLVKLRLPVTRLKKPLLISINGEVLVKSVQYCTLPFSLQIGALHWEEIPMQVCPPALCS